MKNANVATGASLNHPIDSQRNYHIIRNRVALLDLSSEGRLRVAGANAVKVLDRIFSMDLEIVPRWHGVSGLFLREDASIIAIATVFKGDDDECYVFTEAASAATLRDHLRSHLSTDGVQLVDLSASFSCLSVIGPSAQSAVSRTCGDDILGMRYLSFEFNPTLGVQVFRMGFCGEYEYRLLCPVEAAEDLAQRLLEDGRTLEIDRAEPAVLPQLMMEMRSICLHDIPAAANPIDLGMHWMLSFRKRGYPGAEVLQALKGKPGSRALMLRFEKTGIACAGDRLEIDGTDVGFCSSVVFSPTLGQDIGLACVDPVYGWVGVPFSVDGPRGVVGAVGVSAPLFVTKTVSSV